MSELDVIVIHIRAEQAAEYERLFAERELPRWREYKARGAFLSARISRVAFGTDNREDVVKYAIAVEVPSHSAHSEHDADPWPEERIISTCHAATGFSSADGPRGRSMPVPGASWLTVASAAESRQRVHGHRIPRFQPNGC